MSKTESRKLTFSPLKSLECSYIQSSILHAQHSIQLVKEATRISSKVLRKCRSETFRENLFSPPLCPLFCSRDDAGCSLQKDIRFSWAEFVLHSWYISLFETVHFVDLHWKEIHRKEGRPIGERGDWIRLWVIALCRAGENWATNQISDGGGELMNRVPPSRRYRYREGEGHLHKSLVIINNFKKPILDTVAAILRWHIAYE